MNNIPLYICCSHVMALGIIVKVDQGTMSVVVDEELEDISIEEIAEEHLPGERVAPESGVFKSLSSRYAEILSIMTFTFTRSHTYNHTNIQPYNHTYKHTYIQSYINAYIHTTIHTYNHTYIQPCIHTTIHTYNHTYMHVGHSFSNVFAYTLLVDTLRVFPSLHRLQLLLQAR